MVFGQTIRDDVSKRETKHHYSLEMAWHESWFHVAGRLRLFPAWSEEHLTKGVSVKDVSA
jgi:hypothetical protein